MTHLEATLNRPPLVLLVDPVVASRHSMWRVLSRGFAVLEAGSAAAARAWMTQRPDIDVLVVEDDLPDGRGVDFVQGLVEQRHPIASNAVVLSGSTDDDARSFAEAGAALIERGDLCGLLSKLASALLARDAMLARFLMREAERFRS